MSYGVSGYGTVELWGGGGAYAPPLLTGITPADDDGMAYAEEDGGTLLTLVGTGFAAPMIVHVMRAGTFIVDKLGKPARAFVFDQEFDITANRVFAGFPSLPPGLYDVSVETPGGVSTLVNAVEYRLYAEQERVVTLRAKFGSAWRAGHRFLRG